MKPLFPSRKHPFNVTLAGIEELDLFPNETAKQTAIKEHADSIRGWSLVLGIVVMGTIGLGALFATRMIVVPIISQLMPSGLPVWSREPLQWAIVVAVMFVCVRALHRWGARRSMRTKLVKLGVPVCMGCGYLLKGLPPPPESERCPECGRAFDQAVRDAMCSSSNAASPADAELAGGISRPSTDTTE